ncbi:hypothetical protein T03_3723 [Trichinella britovi]|uniref:Uncharacterized protein n=1 Tax=Trichinella britovi TaxID=45882 RepID=A0A0V1CKX6_TRIBR|nr:hypothetical protein T03_3723 [Trichinella britovi]
MEYAKCFMNKNDLIKNFVCFLNVITDEKSCTRIDEITQRSSESDLNSTKCFHQTAAGIVHHQIIIDIVCLPTEFSVPDCSEYSFSNTALYWKQTQGEPVYWDIPS